jgi:hypothetical protein
MHVLMWRRGLQVAAVASAAILIGCFPVKSAERGTGKIVGLGATSCGRFLMDAEAQPAVQRDYLAWAQGYMSGILLSRPPGVDDNLDLMPPGTPLLAQLQFLRERCKRAPEEGFADAVEDLYKHLRKSGGV